MFRRRPQCVESLTISPLPSRGTSPFFRESERDAVQVFPENGTKKRIYATNTGSVEPLRGHILFSPGTIFYYNKDTIIFNKLQHNFIYFFYNLSKLLLYRPTWTRGVFAWFPTQKPELNGVRPIRGANLAWANASYCHAPREGVNSLLIKSQVEIQEIIQIDFGYNK